MRWIQVALSLGRSWSFHRFCATNAAFAQLPPGIVDTLLKPENKD